MLTRFPILRVVVFALVILILFGLTVVAIAYGLSWTGGEYTARTELISISSALFIWAIVGVFYFKKHTVTLKYSERNTFFRNVRAELADLGYEQKEQTDTLMTFQPSFHARL